MPTAGSNYHRDISQLVRAWERHYTARGFVSQRMQGVAYGKANAGKIPPGSTAKVRFL